MRSLVYAALVWHLVGVGLAARAVADAAARLRAMRWLLHEEPRAAAEAICGVSRADEGTAGDGDGGVDGSTTSGGAFACAFTLSWRAADGAFADVCPALRADPEGKGFRLPRYYRLAAVCNAPWLLRAVAARPLLSLTIFR